RWLGVLDPDRAVRTVDIPGVADLAAGLAVERRAVEEDLHLVAFRGLADLAPVPAESQDGGVGLQLVVTGETGARQRRHVRPALARHGARAGPLLRHGGLEPGHVHF